MKSRLMYVELKTNHSDDGPAWIGKAFFSKTGRLLYFNGLAFAKGSRSGGNYYEVLNVDYYWISGIKKEGTNRHWAGGGKIQIDKDAIEEYLEITKLSVLPNHMFEVVELNNTPPVEATQKFMNLKF
jgi:hypothetical protein